MPALIVLFARITPDIEELDPVEVYKLPPIPTPPDTVNAPVEEDVETVECVILTTPVDVLFVNVVEPETDAPVPE